MKVRAITLAMCAVLFAQTLVACGDDDDDDDTGANTDTDADTSADDDDNDGTDDTDASDDDDTVADDDDDDATDTAGNDDDATTGDDDDDGAAYLPDGSMKFPKDFLWGVATAGFQNDNGCPTLEAAKCNDEKSDWWEFTTSPVTVNSPGAYLSGQNPGVVSPGFYELYDEDIERAHSIGLKALRMSIEWSRIFPEPTDDVEGHDALKAIANDAAIAHYKAIFASLKKRGMKPLVTLIHYSLPVWLHDAPGCHTDLAACTRKGWVDEERALREAAKYAGFCATEFGGDVDLWVTLNEPLQNLIFGYLQPGETRSHPPARLLASDEARIVLDAQIFAHAKMYDAVKAADLVDADGDGEKSRIGVVYPFAPIDPLDPESALDKKTARNIDYIWNRVYLLATATGRYDEDLDGDYEEEGVNEELVNRMDYVGINYYFGISVKGTRNSFLPEFSPLLTFDPLKFGIGGNIPSRMPEMLAFVRDDLQKPIIITENGEPHNDADPEIVPRFLVNNLRYVHKSLLEGTEIGGYFWWTLTDNFEWNHGMDIRMGLWGVDKDDPTKERVERVGAGTYKQVTDGNTLPKALLDKYPDQNFEPWEQ